MELLGIEMPFEEFDKLMCEQANGKELKVINGKVIAVEHKITQEELDRKELNELEFWFNNYFEKQLIQSTWQKDFKISHDNYFNCDYVDIEELKLKAEEVRARIKELRKVEE